MLELRGQTTSLIFLLLPQAANERLEQALVQANGGAGGASGQVALDDEDTATQLTIQLAEREGQLQAARQQVEELEALQALARVRPTFFSWEGNFWCP